jgi:hypothetical protein
LSVVSANDLWDVDGIAAIETQLNMERQEIMGSAIKNRVKYFMAFIPTTEYCNNTVSTPAHRSIILIYWGLSLFATPFVTDRIFCSNTGTPQRSRPYCYAAGIPQQHNV